jgi:hypothetical protein
MILSVHERILREALGDVLGAPSLRAVIRANRRSDLHQLAPHYHFDSAPDPRALCRLWQRGLHTWLSRAVELSAPRDAAALRLVDRGGALAAFGRATHALADFYSHTNWIELAVARGEPPQPAPLLGGSCEPERLPVALQSGYFSLRHGLSGCPRSGPPPGFAYCHAQLNKDAPTRGHGAERPAPGAPTYHEMAVRLAIDSTRAAWDRLCYRIEAAHGEAAPAARISARLAQRESSSQ